MDQLTTVVVTASGVEPVTTAAPVSASGSASIAHLGASASATLSSLPPCSGDATLTIAASGDFNGAMESATVSVDGTFVGTYAPLACNASRTFQVSCTALADGQATVQFTTSTSVNNGGCTGQTEKWSATLTYTSSDQGSGTIVSIPINFALFDGKKLWEKVHLVGAGTISLRVLDASSNPIPDTQIPGNAAGNTDRTLRLFDLNPALYPVIRLEATLSPGARLTEWSVVGNDVHEWLFSHAGDAEGWAPFDTGATPAVTVMGGVLRFDSAATGTDPNIQYTFPQPTPATRFTTLEVRLKTSNAYNNDDPTLLWQSNFGLFDTRRSFVLKKQFLVTFKDLSFDLTQVPPAPGEPWQGNIEKLRLDPVAVFLNQAQMPEAGWFEIDRIALY